MITWIQHWFILRRAKRLYQRLVTSDAQSFEEIFKKRVAYLVAMLKLQFGGHFIVSYEQGKATVARNGLVWMEVTIDCRDSSFYLVVMTNVRPLPLWWLQTAFSGLRWSVTQFPMMPQLTHEKPHEP